MFCILDENHEVVHTDGDTWREWFKNADRRVAETTLPNGIWVSTVFLGLYGQIFETMAFKSGVSLGDLGMIRTETWDEAVQAHNAVVERLQLKLPEEP